MRKQTISKQGMKQRLHKNGKNSVRRHAFIVANMLLAVGMMSLSSCGQDEFPIEQEGVSKLEPMSFTADNAKWQPVAAANEVLGGVNEMGVGSRTALASDGLAVNWVAGDVIGIGYEGLPNAAPRPFSTKKPANPTRFDGVAERGKPVYFAIYPHDVKGKMTDFTADGATFHYTTPSVQTAVENGFDPKANVSVAIIPNEEQLFKSYNTGALLKIRFNAQGVNVSKVIFEPNDATPICGDVVAKTRFSGGVISQFEPYFKGGSAITLMPAKGQTLKSNTYYYIAVPALTLEKGYRLSFITSEGKGITLALPTSKAVQFKRGEVYNGGTLQVDGSKMKAKLLVNVPMLNKIASQIPGLQQEPDGTINLYKGNNLDLVRNYNGKLTIDNVPELTTLNELPYFKSVTSIEINNNPKLEGKVDLTKLPLLQGEVKVNNCGKVDAVDIRGLQRVGELNIDNMPILKHVGLGGNPTLRRIHSWFQNAFEELDLSNLPALEEVEFHHDSDGKLKQIRTSNSPNLKKLWVASNSAFKGFPDLAENVNLENLSVIMTGVETLDVSHQPKLRILSTIYSNKLNSIKGLDVVGKSLYEFTITGTPISSVDLTHNPDVVLINTNLCHNLVEIKGLEKMSKLHRLEVVGTKLTSLDLSPNKALTFLEAQQTPLQELLLPKGGPLKSVNVSQTHLQKLDLGDNRSMERLLCSLSYIDELDISKCPLMHILWTGGQLSVDDSKPGDKKWTNILKQIRLKLTSKQATKLNDYLNKKTSVKDAEGVENAYGVVQEIVPEPKL
jgi:leucine rich repeat protein